MNNKINLILRPSRYFFTLISGIHLIILFIACIVNLPAILWWLLIILFLMIIYSYYYLVNKYIYRKHKYAVYALWQDMNSTDPNQWFLKFDNKHNKSNIITAILQPKGYVTDFMIIMHFTIKSKSKLAKLFKILRNKTIPVIIISDMLDYKDYHRLKMYLLGYKI